MQEMRRQNAGNVQRREHKRAYGNEEEAVLCLWIQVQNNRDFLGGCKNTE